MNYPNNIQNFSSIETIIWDWNGTILDDVDICILAMNQMLSKRNMANIDNTFYYEHFTFPVVGYYKDMGWDFSKESFEDLSIEFMKNYDELFDSSPLQKDTLKTLEYYKTQNYKQIVVSVLENSRLQESLSIHGLDHFFNAAYGIENILGGGKVHLAKRMIAEQNINPQTTCMIGDTDHDLEVALAIGTKCILVSHGHHTFDKLQTLNCLVVKNFTELRDILKKDSNFKF